MVELRQDSTSLSFSSDEDQNTFIRNFQDKLESKNHWERIVALGKVTKIFDSAYLNEEKQFTELDKKLIKGFYRRALFDYKNLETKKNTKNYRVIDSHDSDS